MLPDHLKNKHFFFVVSTNYLSCFNDYGGGKGNICMLDYYGVLI